MGPKLSALYFLHLWDQTSPTDSTRPKIMSYFKNYVIKLVSDYYVIIFGDFYLCNENGFRFSCKYHTCYFWNKIGFIQRWLSVYDSQEWVNDKELTYMTSDPWIFRLSWPSFDQIFWNLKYFWHKIDPTEFI